MVFALGAVVSIYQDVQHIRHPEEMVSPHVNYVLFDIAILSQGASWLVALKNVRKSEGQMGYFEAFHRSKDPTTFSVLFEDSAALIGLIIVLIGIFLAQYFNISQIGGIASILIGVVLAISAFLFGKKIKALLLDETIDQKIRQNVLNIAQQDPWVHSANGVLKEQMGIHQLITSLSLEFKDSLTSDDTKFCVNRIEAEIKKIHLKIVALFIKPQTQQVWLERMKGRLE